MFQTQLPAPRRVRNRFEVMNLKELAAKLGLSPTTVSRALNGYPEVTEATRERGTIIARMPAPSALPRAARWRAVTSSR